MSEPDLTVAAENLRAVLAAVADPDDELTASAATRHRIEGAALALEVLAGHPSESDVPAVRLRIAATFADGALPPPGTS